MQPTPTADSCSGAHDKRAACSCQFPQRRRTRSQCKRVHSFLQCRRCTSHLEEQQSVGVQRPSDKLWFSQLSLCRRPQSPLPAVGGGGNRGRGGWCWLGGVRLLQAGPGLPFDLSRSPWPLRNDHNWTRIRHVCSVPLRPLRKLCGADNYPQLKLFKVAGSPVSCVLPCFLTGENFFDQ